MAKPPLHRFPKPVNAPSVDQHVLRDLRAIDPDLVPVFSNHLLMPDGSVARDQFGAPADWPRWTIFLWSDRDNRFYRILTVETPEKDYLPLDNRTVRFLRADLIRVKGLKGAINHRAEMREKEREATKKQLASDRRDWVEANEGKVREAMDNPHHRYSTHRQAKAFGYKGQINKDTSNRFIEKTAKELGYQNEPLEGSK